MKIKYGLILATMLSTSVMAQVSNNAPPMPPMPPTPNTSVAPPMPPMPTPPDATTNKPPGRVKKAKKKKTEKPAAVKKEKAEASAAAAPAAPVAPLVAGQIAESKQNHVNIRGQAHINSEVIGHLKKGETVTVLEEVTLKHPKADEPKEWLRIALPEDMHVWVDTAFIDSSNQVVKVRKLNIRTGAGENYSVIGLLHKGDAIKSKETKGRWTEIEAPTNAFGFVAAHLLAPKEGGASTPEPTPAPVPPPVPTVVENQNTVATAPNTAPGHEAVPITQPAVPLPPIPAPVAPAVSDEPLPKRIVEREGVVGGTFSIQAPTYFELRSLDNGHVMDYLYTSSTNVVLKNYKGKTILVSGEEELDERWPNTPVITIQRIQVVK